MAILNIQPIQIGLVGVRPGLWSIRTNDTIGTVMSSGYLTVAFNQGNAFMDGDAALVITTTSPSSTDFNTSWYQINGSSSGVWSLMSSSGPGNVTLPTISNHIAVYNNTTGGLGEDATIAFNGGSIQAGLSGTSGSLISYPATAAKGSLVITAVANTGNTTVTLQNASHGQASAYNIPDCGTTTANFIISAKSGGQSITVGGLQCTTGSFIAGSGGNAGTFTSNPSTGSQGTLILAAANNGAGDFNTTISNATSVGQSQVISIPDAGGATANFNISPSALVNGNIPMASGTGGVLVDSGIAASSIPAISDVVLLTPTGNQHITADDLILDNGDFLSPIGSVYAMNIYSTTGNITAQQGNCQAGSSGNDGSLISYPATVASGSLLISAQDNSAGNFTTTINNAASVGQDQVISIPDSGAATSNFVLSQSTAPTNNVAFTKVITAGFAALAAAATVTVQANTSGTSQFAVLDIKVLNSTGLSGGGGDRLLQLTDGTIDFSGTGITAALLGTPICTVWDGTGNPIAAGASQVSTAGASLVLQYTGGTTDYTAGEVQLAITLVQVTA